MKTKVIHKPWAELQPEEDGIVTVRLFDPAWGKVWEGWADDKPQALAKAKKQAEQICETSDIEVR